MLCYDDVSFDDFSIHKIEIYNENKDTIETKHISNTSIANIMKVVAFLLALTASNAAAFNHCDFECGVDCCAPGESRYSLFGSCDYECLDRCFIECESGGRSLRGVVTPQPVATAKVQPL